MQRLEKRLGKERILYMDEAGMLAGDVYRWGWSEKGRRKYGQRSGKRQRRVNFIAAASGQKQFIEPLVFEGACTREVVENWLEVLVEQLPQDEDGQKQPHVLVMDNAAFHKGGRIKAILQKARCLLVWLPPYSPQLNPIERCWSSVKCKVGQWLDRGMDLRRMGQKRSCFRQPCLYRTKKELLITRQGEIILYKPYIIHLSHPVMTSQFAL